MVEDLFVKHPERRTDWAGQNMLGRLSSPQEYRSVYYTSHWLAGMWVR